MTKPKKEKVHEIKYVYKTKKENAIDAFTMSILVAAFVLGIVGGSIIVLILMGLI